MRRILLLAVLAAAVGSGVAWAEPPDQQPAAPASASQSTSDKTDVTIYPFYIWAPIMGLHANLPNLPELPSRPPGEGGGSPITTDASLNAAYGMAVDIESHKWLFGVSLVYAGLSGELSSPRTRVTADLTFGGIMGGRRLVGGLAAVAGVRRFALDVGINLLDLPEFKRKPGVWDPLIGVDWRQPLGKKWIANVNFMGGGFGVGTDVDLSLTARIDWRVVKHVQLSLGYGMLHFKLTNGIGDRTFTIKQTLNGPQFGLGIVF